MYVFNTNTLITLASTENAKFEFERQVRYNQILEKENKEKQEALKMAKAVSPKTKQENSKPSIRSVSKKELKKITLAAIVFTR